MVLQHGMSGAPTFSIEGQVFAGVGLSGGTVEEDVDILESALREPAVASTINMTL
jgi:uncharacterized protein GlcG (DUF336 family)